MLHSTEEQLRVHKKQTLFLTQLTAKTLPKGLHCLPLRLTTEYYTLNSSQRHFPNQEKLEDPRLFHYALFSDNVLAAAVVVNSTVTHAKVIYSSLKYALILPLVAKKIGENIRKLAISFLYSLFSWKDGLEHQSTYYLSKEGLYFLLTCQTHHVALNLCSTLQTMFSTSSLIGLIMLP